MQPSPQNRSDLVIMTILTSAVDINLVKMLTNYKTSISKNERLILIFINLTFGVLFLFQYFVINKNSTRNKTISFETIKRLYLYQYIFELNSKCTKNEGY